MNRNSGVSLISVVVMVIIMILIATVAMSNGLDSINEATDVKVSVEVSELKKAVADKMIEMETKPGVTMPGQIIGNLDDIHECILYVDNLSNSELESFKRNVNPETIDNYRIINSGDAIALGVSSIQEDHYFIVDYNTGKVYGLLNKIAYDAR